MPDKETAEIKINLAGTFDRANETLQLSDGEHGELYFLDDVTPGLPSALPLLKGGIVLRVRSKGKKSDVTVKLRPCRRSQLRAHWLALIGQERKDGKVEFTAQQDWSGARHTLAVSAKSRVSADDIGAARDGGDMSSLFADDQRDFLTDCGAFFVNPAQLTMLGPIKITRWERILFEGFSLNIERWRLDSLDRLEMSIVRDLETAPVDQARLSLSVADRGLAMQKGPENKTEIFMAAMAECLT